MKKLVRSLLIAIVAIFVICCVTLLLFFDDTYQSRYSSGVSNSKAVSVVINNAINSGQISASENEMVLYGKIVHDKVYLTSTNGNTCDMEFETGSDMGNIYWAVSVTDNRVNYTWTCSKDILDDSKLVPYNYGDQKDFISVYCRKYIGYYSSSETENKE